MKIIVHLFLLSILMPYLGYCQSFTIEQSIISSSDDAEEKYDGSFVTTTSTDIELMYDTWNDQRIQTVGLRFDNVSLPTNASVLSAYIQFTADDSDSENIIITIQGESSGNSATFSNTVNNISSRTTTNSSVTWSPLPWTEDQAGLNERTPDLSSIVSEIISSNGWQIGRPITFILTGAGSSSERRKADTYDNGSTLAAKLVIEYSPNNDVDLGITSCIVPTPTTLSDPAANIQVEITNFGNLTANNYEVSYSLNGTLMATEPGNVALNVAESVNFTFAQTADLSNLGSYTLTVDVNILNDAQTQNNSITKLIEVISDRDTLFFDQGSSWRYYDSNQDPGISWFDVSFDDTAWLIGDSEFGFGDGDEQTELNGNVSSYYFRKNVTIANANELDDIFIHMIHDDGAIVYINGQEVVRTELIPLGNIAHTTPARQRANESNENNFYTYKINSDVLVNGLNTIAISIRKSNATSNVSFDCYISPEFEYDQDGPYVSYQGNNIIVEEVTPSGLVSNTYTTASDIELTCELPHMNTRFSFNLKPFINIEPSTYISTPPKFLAISDFDGHIEGFTMLLRGEGIIDEDFNWIYGNGHLMISGDLFDRGFHITESMWLLYKLESEAQAQGGQVHLILGNHEIFNLTDDWRYVEVKYFNNAHLMGKRMTELYDSNTELGRWLRSKNIIQKVGDYAFMHGGISPQLAALNLSYDQINEYGRMEINGIPCPNADCGVVNSGNGPYWYRGMVDEELTQEQVDMFLDSLDVQRVVLGHTKGSTIRSLYNDRVMAIDMYHIDNFNDGFMEALSFEIGCFYLFHTDQFNDEYTQIGDCDEYTPPTTGTQILEVNGENQLKIYPNPSSKVLTLEMPNKLIGQYSYTITDLEGKTIGHGEIGAAKSTIPLDYLSAGKYFLTLSNSKNTISGHFVLKP